MKRIVILCGLLLLGVVSHTQNLLNGSFENNSAVFDQINLVNASFNSFMLDTYAFGSFGNMDIINSSTYCGAAQNGSWYVSLTGGLTDAITMTLSTPLVSGQTYTLTFWDRGCIAFSTSSPAVQIGVSNVNSDIGTVVYTAATPVESVWTQRTATFVAPINGLYLSVSTPVGSTSDWVQIDNFSFVETDCPLALNLGPDVNLCTDESATFDASLPGGTYLWSNGATSPQLTVNLAGTYAVSVTVDECVYTDEVVVVATSTPLLDLGADQVVCAGETVVLDATTPGATYLWQDGSVSATFVTTDPGTYSCTVNVSGCEASDTVVVSTDPVPVVELGPALNGCVGDTFTLDASYPGATYLWQDGSTGATLAVDEGGEYAVVVSLGNCEDSDEVTVTLSPFPVVDLGPDTTLCFGAAYTLSALNPGAVYLWQDGSTGATFTATAAGNYSVEASIGGCSTSGNVQISFIDSIANPITLLLTPFCLEEADSVRIDAEGAFEPITWSTGDTATAITVTTAGVYSYSLPLECQTLTGQIEVQPCSEVIPVVIDVFVPNAFTPDDDGINDYFRPSVFTTLPIDRYSMRIFNRWGEAVFETEDPLQGWMGEVRAGAYYAPDGVYVYRLEITSGVLTKEFEGHVVALR
jgi:gliding motility-associated-like protein